MTLQASYYAGKEYNPVDMMQRDSDWISPGVISASDLVVAPTTTPSMAVTVSGASQGQIGGNAWLPGGYRVYNDSQATLTIAAANVTNPRIDLLIACIDTTTSPYTPGLRVITGTPAASPTVPSIPAGLVAISLAQVYVTANATTIVAGNITDVRTIAGLQGDASRINNLNSQPEFAAHLAEIVATPTANKIPRYGSDGDLLVYSGKSRPNILPNSTFNFGSQGWIKMGGSVNFVISFAPPFANYPSDGQRGYVNYPSSTGAGEFATYVSNPIYVPANIKLLVSGDMFTGGVTSGTVYIEVDAYDINNNNLGTVCFVFSVNGKQWTRYSSTVGTTPTNTSYVKVILAVGQNTVNTNCSWRRIKLEALTSNETSLVSSPYSQESDMIYSWGSTWSDVTYNIDPVNGNDNNDGLTGSTCFKTMAKALSILPRFINHNITLNLTSGSLPLTINEDVSVNGFMGGGTLKIIGSSTYAGAGSYNIKSVSIGNCKCNVVVTGVTITAGNPALNINHCNYVYFENSNIPTFAGDGISVFDAHLLYGTGAVNGRVNAIYASELTRVRLYSVTGSGNTIGIKTYGGIVQRTGSSTVTGTTATQNTEGGQIW